MTFEQERAFILEQLQGRLWHTTHPDRFQSILKCGAIIPEPNISENERWKTSGGSDYYPYVRTIDGVSLFDFDNFDPCSYSEKYPLSSWHEFVPYRQEWGCAVWIELDREQVADNLISASDLVARWKSEKAYRHTIMPYIEAAYIGKLLRIAFVRALAFQRGEEDYQLLKF